MTTISVDDIEIPRWRTDLVYVDYRDGFSPEQVERLIRGAYDDHTDDWIGHAQWEAATELARELLAEHDLDPDDDELFDPLYFRILDADTSNPYRDLMRNTDHMLFRFSPREDDMAWLDSELEDPAATRAALGLDPAFEPVVGAILPEIAGYRAEGGGWFGATFVFRADPHDLWWDIDPQGTIVVSDPFLWLTNPYSGNGMGKVAKGLTVTLPMPEVHVDQFAWGYGADDVFGGLILNDSTITKGDA